MSSFKKLPQAAHFAAKKATMMPPGSYDGKVVFITGGGTGLGKGMTQKFSELGARVVIAARYCYNFLVHSWFFFIKVNQ